MSKYIKLEDALTICQPLSNYPTAIKEVLELLPTIEVSEEQLSKLQSSENSVENTTVSEDFTSISRANSKLEVSEDSKAYTYCSRCGMRVVVDLQVIKGLKKLPDIGKQGTIYHCNGEQWIWFEDDWARIG